MKFSEACIVILLVIVTGCTSAKKRVTIDDVVAEGDISKDTVYNGLIKFYNINTHQLTQTINYKEGIMDGERIDFYPNGKRKLELAYQNGKINGEIKHYDSTGEISEIQYIYHSLRVGPTTSYKNKEIVEYSFHSLENKELFYINYDSIKGKNHEDLNEGVFFFFNYNNYHTSRDSTPKTELFIYLPNPPVLNFNYSLCIIDSNYNTIQNIKKFSSENIWETIDLNFEKLKENESYAIVLKLNSGINNDSKTITMFKRLYSEK